MADGFESSVAQRMPSTRAHARRQARTLPEAGPPKVEPPRAEVPETEAPKAETLKAGASEAAPAAAASGGGPAAAQAPHPPPAGTERPARVHEAFIGRRRAAPQGREGGDVLRIVGQLKGQLLALEATKRALERELSTARRQVEHLAADNKALREELEAAGVSQAELARLRQENSLLEEEAADVLSRLEQLNRETREQRERLAALSAERQDAAAELDRLREAGTEGELLRIKVEFLTREKDSLAEENDQLGREAEALKDERDGLRREVATLKKSLREVRESLLLVRDSARSDYYDLT